MQKIHTENKIYIQELISESYFQVRKQLLILYNQILTHEKFKRTQNTFNKCIINFYFSSCFVLINKVLFNLFIRLDLVLETLTVIFVSDFSIQPFQRRLQTCLFVGTTERNVTILIIYFSFCCKSTRAG